MTKKMLATLAVASFSIFGISFCAFTILGSYLPAGTLDLAQSIPSISTPTDTPDPYFMSSAAEGAPSHTPLITYTPTHTSGVKPSYTPPTTYTPTSGVQVEPSHTLVNTYTPTHTSEVKPSYTPPNTYTPTKTYKPTEDHSVSKTTKTSTATNTSKPRKPTKTPTATNTSKPRKPSKTPTPTDTQNSEPPPTSPNANIKYAGVNVEKMKWQSADPGSPDYTPSMRLWETFTEGRYVSARMEAFLRSLKPEFNTVRIMVGSRHLVHPVVAEGYKKNLIHTLQVAKEEGIWVVIGIWPSGVYPYDDYDDNETSDVTYYQYDPYFYDPDLDDGSGDIKNQNNFELVQKPAMRMLAQLISDNGFSNVLYIDLRNEINGHIGDAYNAYDDEWYSQSSPWGYVPNRASYSFRNWLKDKYGTIENLNSAWGGTYTGFNQIPIFRTYSTEIKDKFSHPTTVSEDIQAWLIWCLRDWVTQLKQVIKGVDSNIRVGQSTTGDSYYTSYPAWEITTRYIYRQYEIADLVDVMDYHMYRLEGNEAVIGQLKAEFPNKLFIVGEFYNDISKKVTLVNDLGGDGILFWSSACPRGYGALFSCIHYWDDWSLTSAGDEFYKAIEPYKDYVNP
jgi:hypothetical protein